MSLQPTPVPPVPAETARVARLAFPRGHLYLQIRDQLPACFTDEQFQDLFPTRGRPAEAPWRLALVTLLQFAENLSDRQAADAVRSRLDWKYLLGLELTDPGFHYSLLCDFRARLLAGGAEWRLFELLLARLRAQQLVKARGTQRTDATHVLAAVRTLNRLELVGETLRHALNTLAVVAPEWLLAHCQPAWRERYARRFPDQRLPRSRAEREALAVTIGQDGRTLLAAVYDPGAPPTLREVPAVEVLRQVWVQQYYGEDPPQGPPALRWRTAEELPPAERLIQSPYDPEAHYSNRQERPWVGYVEHTTESCEADQPLVITDVQTTAAPIPDQQVLPAIQANLARRDLLPAQQVVDTGYLDADGLVASQEQYGIELVGPPQRDSSWQARAGTGFAAADFRIDWTAQVAYCPAGQASVRWQERQKRGRTCLTIDFPRSVCQACPQRSQCTRAGDHGRRLTLQPEPAQEALQAARARAQTDAFADVYATRAGIEGTHSQGVRRCGLRHCRYWGLAKTHLQHLLTAAALNLVRVGYWLLETPRARTRTDAFLRLTAPVG
jgi:transposase